MRKIVFQECLITLALLTTATMSFDSSYSLSPRASTATYQGIQLTNDSSNDNIRLSWSPNGSNIEFSKLPLPPSCCQSKIWGMHGDGTGQRQCSGGTLDDSPSFSPDGSNITYNHWPSLKRGDHSEIFIARNDCANPYLVTHDPSDITYEYPSYSPDGKTIVYSVLVGTTGAPNPHHFWVFTIGTDGTIETNLTKGTEPVFTPDNHKIIYVIADPELSNDTIAMYSLDTHVVTRITDGPFDFFPKVFANGTTVAFARCASIYQHCDIYSINIDGSNLRQLTFDGSTHLNLYPAVSPDGSKIAYASNRTGNFQIWVMSLQLTPLIPFPNVFRLIAVVTTGTAILFSGMGGYLFAKRRRIIR